MVFNPLVSLADTLVGDRGRFRPRSLRPGRSRRSTGGRSGAADLVVADTAAQAELFRSLGARRVEVCFVGAEERLFMPGWARPAEGEFTALFVGKLIPLHGLETILAAARLAPELRFRVVGSGQLEPLLDDRPPNVEHVSLGRLRAPAGRAAPRIVRARHLRDVGQGGPGDPEQGVPGTRLRHAADHRRHAGRARAPPRRRERAARSARAIPRRWRRRCAGSQPTRARRRPSRPAGSPPTASTRARTFSAHAGAS